MRQTSIGNANEHFYYQSNSSGVNITSQTQPDASPSVGLRLVGLLPCAVWSPKIPKPTIGQLQRVQATPYTVTSNASSIRSVADPSTSSLSNPANRYLAVSQRPELASSSTSSSASSSSVAATSCRCATLPQKLPTEQHLLPSHISSNHRSSTETLTTIAPIGQSAPISHQRATNLRPVSSTSNTNPMLLVPFAAMPPGFVPIQGQIPVVATSTNVPATTGAYRKFN